MAQVLTATVGAPESRRAPSRSRIVPRERLVQRLAEARQVPVALLIAPAGYGKTTVLREWAGRDGRPFAWVTVDAEDNGPATLLSTIALALDGVEPIGPEVFDALSAGRPDAAQHRLVGALGRMRLPVVLVLDDLHALETRESRAVVMAISQALSGGSQVALASNSDSALPVGRLRAHGGAVELRAEDLAMTRSEAKALLRLAGVEVGPEQVFTLMRRTAGWPVGLYLAALSLLEQGGDDTTVDDFRGDDRFVTDYVREELLSGLPAEQIEFLTRTSVLDRLTAPVCDAVLDRDDSAGMLMRLARSNVLLLPLDRSDTSYRYPELFADVLRAELHRREPNREGFLHRRASAWCAANGDAGRAIGHAIDAQDLPRAARLMWEGVLPCVASGRGAQLAGWLNRFTDDELAGNPLLALVAAGRSLATGDLYEAQRWTSVAAGVTDDTDLVEAGMAIMRAAIARDGIAKVGADAVRAYGLLEQNSPWRPLCLLLEGVARHLAGDRGGALVRLQDGAHRAAVSAPMVQALCLAQLALLAIDEEDRERATALAGRAYAQVERCGLDGCPAMALVFAVSAALAAERGQVAKAGGDAQQALGLLDRITDPSPWYAIECRIVLARAALRDNGPAASRELLAVAARELRRTSDAPVLTEWLDETRLQVDLALGSAPAADWSLTTAELRVLRYLPSHLSFREIAGRLYVSPNTVKTHARGIYRKLGVSSRGHAVDRAQGAGLVDPVPGG